jgi:ribonuclease G
MNLPAHSTIKAGDYIPVQVQKDATGDKGANVSERLMFNGRLTIVYPSRRKEIGVSQKITDKAERKRLHAVAQAHLPAGFGVILRTLCAGKGGDEIKAEMDNLTALCTSTLARARYLNAPSLLYHAGALYDDILSDDIDAIYVGTPDIFNEVRDEVARRVPALAERVKPHDTANGTLFGVYGVEVQIARALNRNVWLPCGGFITVDECEACVVIDVNTGKYTGRKDYREAVLRVNVEAAECIAAQITLRNLSGMMIVDFIDMPAEEDKHRLIAEFKRHLSVDRIPAKIIGMTELGLVQLTRRKKREPLSRLLEKDCPNCRGTGRVRKESMV